LHRPALQPGLGGIQQTRHFLGRFALDAHGQAERANFQIAQLSVEQLPHEICGLFAGERTRALLAAADVFEIGGDAHGRIVRDLR